MHVVSDGMLAHGIWLKTDSWIVLVPISRCVGQEQMWWHGDVNMINVFRKLGNIMVAQGVVFAEGLAGMGYGFPVGWAIPITKGFACGHK